MAPTQSHVMSKDKHQEYLPTDRTSRRNSRSNLAPTSPHRGIVASQILAVFSYFSARKVALLQFLARWARPRDVQEYIRYNLESVSGTFAFRQLPKDTLPKDHLRFRRVKRRHYSSGPRASLPREPPRTSYGSRSADVGPHTLSEKSCGGINRGSW